MSYSCLLQGVLLNTFLLSHNKQDTSHKSYMWHGNLAGNLTLVSLMLLCLCYFVSLGRWNWAKILLVCHFVVGQFCLSSSWLPPVYFPLLKLATHETRKECKYWRTHFVWLIHSDQWSPYDHQSNYTNLVSFFQTNAVWKHFSVLHQTSHGETNNNRRHRWTARPNHRTGILR